MHQAATLDDETIPLTGKKLTVADEIGALSSRFTDSH